MSNSLINPLAGSTPNTMTYTDATSGSTVPNTGWAFTPQYIPLVADISADLRVRISVLEHQLLDKETALREAYMEIGRLHETLRGLTGFKAWSEQVAQTKQP
jgi:hypothetical protein